MPAGYCTRTGRIGRRLSVLANLSDLQHGWAIALNFWGRHLENR